MPTQTSKRNDLRVDPRLLQRPWQAWSERPGWPSRGSLHLAFESNNSTSKNDKQLSMLAGIVKSSPFLAVSKNLADPSCSAAPECAKLKLVGYLGEFDEKHQGRESLTLSLELFDRVVDLAPIIGSTNPKMTSFEEMRGQGCRSGLVGRKILNIPQPSWWLEKRWRLHVEEGFLWNWSFLVSLIHFDFFSLACFKRAPHTHSN